MGIDLTLLRVVIIDLGESVGYGYAQTNIDLNRRCELFAKIRTLPATPAPADFWTNFGADAKGEQAYRLTTVDPYGDPLQCVTAGRLYELANYPGAQDGDNRAAWAYLGALPPDTQIALYWY